MDQVRKRDKARAECELYEDIFQLAWVVKKNAESKPG